MIYCFGDSHVRIFSGANLQHTLLSPSFTAQSSYLNQQLDNAINNIKFQEGDFLLLCFGEIDIRMHISKYSIENDKIDIEKMNFYIDQVIINYLKTIDKFSKTANIIIYMPTASYLPTVIDEYTHGTTQQRNFITKEFIKRLIIELDVKNIKHVSIFENMIDEELNTKPETLEGIGNSNIHANTGLINILQQQLQVLQ